LPDDLASPSRSFTDNEMHDPVFPNGCAVCEVEIDPIRGLTHSTRYCVGRRLYGRCINPASSFTAQTQARSRKAVGQGAVGTLRGRFRFRPAAGRPRSWTYGIAARASGAWFVSDRRVLSPTNPLRHQAGGEGGTTSAFVSYVSGVVERAASLRGLNMGSCAVHRAKGWQTFQGAQARGVRAG